MDSFSSGDGQEFEDFEEDMAELKFIGGDSDSTWAER
jgi:hypothetical protein